MPEQDPRFATFPNTVGVPQLRWLIDQVAENNLPIEELIARFRNIHEAMESASPPKYKNKEEARLIWDVLWAVEFYSTDPAKEENPEEWVSANDLVAEVKRVAKRLKEI